eukprot:TRINITY_DN6738_c0_g3_i2.p1 TRINITY_DN6738_c0_g3~~TRINITY_DN6738_c0_g3_i2.p1  ORF type:complete len:184 (-),score=14.86 TRINITY_DN6738_c0_g3_i2:13-564(-)
MDRETCTYTKCYCEENVWHLCARFESEGFDLSKTFAVFCSNPFKTVPLFCQASSQLDEGLVIWDYHVFLLYQPDNDQHMIYDLDTMLPFPCPARQYVERTFVPSTAYKREYRQQFRVVPAQEYLRIFSSDRSHMFQEGRWLSPPPSYPCIQAPGTTMNLDRFWNMEDRDFFTVMNLQEFFEFV